MYNPFLTDEESREILQCTLLIMMAVNRLSQTNLALSQAATVLKILLAIAAIKSNSATLTSSLSTKPVSVSEDDDSKDRLKILYKELMSSCGVLAATLSARREFVDSCGNGEYKIDPRFMLFEFCHSILLRKAQVDLVRKLYSTVASGSSICHQVSN